MVSGGRGMSLRVVTQAQQPTVDRRGGKGVPHFRVTGAA
jgi:hypothetical protein